MMDFKSVRLSDLGFADQSRRRFLKVSALTAGGGFLIGCAPSACNSKTPNSPEAAKSARPLSGSREA